MSTDSNNPYGTPSQASLGDDFSGTAGRGSSRKMLIRQIAPLSAGKILGALYAVLGLIVGGFFLLASAVGVVAGGQNVGAGLMTGGLSIVFLPLLYGLMGFVGGAFAAFLYNVGASMVGGIELEIET
ncbi:hypothetical protein [Neorhodopirellula pilleata]|uniref:DUF3566 domain-containing protein n=1 Tax=Neorhodopirellula pilleata TaxID=2714738 RepID=A0A5C5ZZX4_9BACT|nr:hypothetical protein [Neorhodopirellula pilleata]TWT92581.1 hypothetical protein Pla100_45990 [Neorhodopirellula pilleata]